MNSLMLVVQDDAATGSSSSEGASLCVVTPYEPTISETFILTHVTDLPARVTLVHGWRPSVGSEPVMSFPRRLAYKAGRMLLGQTLAKETNAAYLTVFNRHKAQAVLAEYGTMGVLCMDTCSTLGIPLIVHFHGYDASEHSVLEQHKETYPKMFQRASALIAVSRSMQQKLITLGAPSEKVYYNPYGIDCRRFEGANPLDSPPVFLAVGRFVDKKAPQLTLSAFSVVLSNHPEARLRMIGDGPLFHQCRDLAEQLGIAHAVAFLGPQGHAVVQEEMRQARCFVQHSVEAPSGDSEGTPVGILEAGASSLPVVATRHAGIPDVVVEGETGFLVDERDVEGMAKYMMQLAANAELADRMGKAARERVTQHFRKEVRLRHLWKIIESCIQGEPLDARGEQD